jgi:hypothetical protein
VQQRTHLPQELPVSASLERRFCSTGLRSGAVLDLKFSAALTLTTFEAILGESSVGILSISRPIFNLL